MVSKNLNQSNRQADCLVRIERSCNQMCVFCNVKNNEGEKFLNENEVKDRIMKLRGAEEILITGGEPTLNKKLEYYIKLAKEYDIKKVTLQTNALLLKYPNFVKKLKESGLDAVFITFHSHNKEKFDTITRVPGSFEKTIKGIENIMENRISLFLNIVLNKLNYKEIKETIIFLNERFGKYSLFKPISFSFVQPHGLALKNKEIVPSVSEIKPFLEDSLGYCKANSIKFGISACGVPACIIPKYFKYTQEYWMIKNGISSDELLVNKENKVKSSRCIDCMINEMCLGIWKAYADMFGTDELIPMRGEKNE